jgi:hypothetical protein
MKTLKRSDLDPNLENYDPYSDLYGYNMDGFVHDDEREDEKETPNLPGL